MQFEILAQPAASVLRLSMDAGEELTAEVGAMIAMSTGFTVETSGRKAAVAG